MNNTDKLLRAFIEASGYEIEEVVETSTFIQKGKPAGFFSVGSPDLSFMTTTTDYKVTKSDRKELTMPLSMGDLFVFGCGSVSEDLMITLEKLGVTSTKEKDLRNVCKEIIDTVAFHIKKDLTNENI